MYAITHRDGTTVCHSSIPFCGYGIATLKDMEQAGYLLLVDGRKAKYPTAAQWKGLTGNA